MRIFSDIWPPIGFLFFVLNGGLAQRDYEAELVSYLRNNITNFSPLLRPTKTPTKVLNISVGAMIGSLVNVDSAKQSVKISAFLQASWTEERLVWNASVFDGVSVVSWDSSQTWFPVIIIYNGIGDNQLLTPQIPVFLRSVSPTLSITTAGWRRELEFTCQFDMTRFPLDRHVCEIEFFFSDQGHNNSLIRLADNVQQFNPLGVYKENGEWRMLNASTYVLYRQYKVFSMLPPVPLPTYVLRIEIQRVSAYYFMNVITPLLLLTLLQVLLYFVPMDSGEKLGFGITIMLSYTVFLLLLDDIVPKSQATPAIASFITAAMVLSTVSLLLTSLIMRFHFRPEGSRMPVCVRAVFVRFLGRLFCVCGPSSNSNQVNAVTSIMGSEVSVRKTNDSALSDWTIAAHALERLMVALGLIATVVIIVVFIVKPYAQV